MIKGIVKWFNMSKGFGFIEAANGTDVFVHFDQVLTGGYEPLKEGQEVTFVLREEARGLRAIDVRVVANPKIKSKPRKPKQRNLKLQKPHGNKPKFAISPQEPNDNKVKVISAPVAKVEVRELKPKVKKKKLRGNLKPPTIQTRSQATGHSRARLFG